MFNLTVQQAHTFYVGSNGWLVRNADIPTPIPYDYYTDRQEYIEKVAKRYRINLSGSGVRFQVIYDESMATNPKYINASAITRYENGIATIHISPKAFDTSSPEIREATIADNLAHELYHARNYVNGNGGGTEEEAVRQGRKLREKILMAFGVCDL